MNKQDGVNHAFQDPPLKCISTKVLARVTLRIYELYLFPKLLRICSLQTWAKLTG